VENIREARMFMKYKQLSFLLPKYKKTQKFVTHQVIGRPYTQIPLFSFLKLSPFLALKRKMLLYHALRSHNKLFSLAPKWIYINHNLMLALLINNPNIVRYSFVDSKTLSTFIGSARYF